MRHRNRGRLLGRERGPRQALYRGLIRSVLTYGRITTTLAKAKAVRPLVERIITAGRTTSLAGRRRVIVLTGDAALAARVISSVAPRFPGRPGGYTRIVKLQTRAGDAADTARLELVA